MYTTHRQERIIYNLIQPPYTSARDWNFYHNEVNIDIIMVIDTTITQSDCTIS